MKAKPTSPPQTPEYAIELEGVTVYREEKKVLDRFSLSVRAGEHVALLGPNGAGKSTLLRLVSRQLHPAAGRRPGVFRILGRPVWNVADLRPLLGVVSDEEFPDLSITGLEAVLSGFFGSAAVYPYQAVTARMRRRAHAVLSRLGCRELAGRALLRMSSGQRRRLMVGRALVHDPAVLVLDEPFNNLDLPSREHLKAAFRALARSGKTLFLVTHETADIFPEIGRVVLLQNGRVTADGPAARVLTAKNLSALFGIGVSVRRAGGVFYARAARADGQV